MRPHRVVRNAMAERRAAARSRARPPPRRGCRRPSASSGTTSTTRPPRPRPRRPRARRRATGRRRGAGSGRRPTAARSKPGPAVAAVARRAQQLAVVREREVAAHRLARIHWNDDVALRLGDRRRPRRRSSSKPASRRLAVLGTAGSREEHRHAEPFALPALEIAAPSVARQQAARPQPARACARTRPGEQLARDVVEDVERAHASSDSGPNSTLVRSAWTNVACGTRSRARRSCSAERSTPVSSNALGEHARLARAVPAPELDHRARRRAAAPSARSSHSARGSSVTAADHVSHVSAIAS